MPSSSITSYPNSASQPFESPCLQISVTDDDITLGDTIGKYEKVISEETIQLGEVNWSFGQVTELRLKFEL